MARNRNTGAKPTTDEEEVAGSKLIWLKTQAYVSDTERLPQGVYLVEEVPERLSKLNRKDCEILNAEKLSPIKLGEIAKWAGIKADEMEAEELIEKVTSPYKTFQ